MSPRLYPTGRFAAMAGVTVRTLRYYDRVGLLRPSAVTPSGHRRYSDHDLVKLQQILALKFLGFPLQDIQEMVRIRPLHLQDSLTVQKRMMEEKRSQIDQVIRAIEDLQRAAAAGIDLDWGLVVQAIRATQMEQDRDGWKKYYSEEAWKKLDERMKTYSQEEAWADAKRWDEVIGGMKAAAARNADPADPEVQELARRWLGLVAEFTMGDEDIREGLQRLYNDASSPFPKPYSEEEEAFIRKALDLCQQRHG